MDQLKKVKFLDVVTRAMDNETFMKELLKDPAAALANAKMTVTPSDLKKLIEIVKDKEHVHHFKNYVAMRVKYGKRRVRGVGVFPW